MPDIKPDRRGYRRLLRARTRTEFRDFTSRVAAFFTLAAGFIGGVGFTIYERVRGVSVDILGVVIASVGGGIVAVGIVWVWLRLTAATLIYSEQSGEIARLQSAFSDAERRAGEREAALLSKLDLRERKKATREALGECFRQGEEVRQWIEKAGEQVVKAMNTPGLVGVYYSSKDIDDPTLLGWFERTEEWEASVVAFLGEYLGQSDVALFRSNIGTVEPHAPELGSESHTNAWVLVDRRLQVLASILKRAGEDLIGSGVPDTGARRR